MEIIRQFHAKYPFVQLLFGLILSFLLASYINWSTSLQQYLLCFVLCLFIFVGLKIGSRRLKGFVLWVILSMSGLLLMSLQLPKNEDLIDKEGYFTAQVLKPSKIRDRQVRLQLQLQQVQNGTEIRKLDLRIMGVFWKDSTARVSIDQGDQIQFKGEVKILDPIYNPHQFDYPSYLKSQGIYFSMVGDLKTLQKISRTVPHWFLEWSNKAQQHLIEKFKTYLTDPVAYQIATAIVFGNRTDFPDEVIQAFANTGTIHILSVSGFHVVLVFAALLLLLGFLDRLKFGKDIKYVLILLWIGVYSAICGFEAPILRASLMIVLFIFGQWHYRFVFSLNTLAASAFFLLLINPHFLFDMGFQLSYAAVFGMMLFTPVFNSFFVSNYAWVNRIREAISLSIAAQLFTTPIALSYFHQFPNYFLPANLLVGIPTSIMVYIGGLLMISPLEQVNHYLGGVLQPLIFQTFNLIKWIDRLPGSTSKGITLQNLDLILMYSILLLILLSVKLKQGKILLLAVILAVTILGMQLTNRIEKYCFVGLKIYNLRQHMAIAYFRRAKLTLFSDLDSLNHPTLCYAIHTDLHQYASSENQVFVHVPIRKSEQLGLTLGDTIHLELREAVSRMARQPSVLFSRNNARIDSMISPALLLLDGSNSWSSIDQNRHFLDSKGQVYYILKDNFAYVWKE